MQQMHSDPSADPSLAAASEAHSYEQDAPDHAATVAAPAHDAGADHMDSGH